MDAEPRYWNLPGGLVAMIPKSGLTTISTSLPPGIESVMVSESDSYQRRVAFIRPWRKRLNSAFSHHTHTFAAGSRHTDVARFDGYEEYIDQVFDDPTNRYWCPVTTMFPNLTEAHPIGDVAEVFPTLIDHWLLPGHANRIKPVPTTDYRLAELRDFYAEDEKLWRSL